MSNFINVEPIKPKESELTPEQETIAQFNFAAWRFHVWGKNVGSYNQIESMVGNGRLKIFSCPDATCDCKYEKNPLVKTDEPDFVCPECNSTNIDWDDEPFICDDCHHEWWLDDEADKQPLESASADVHFSSADSNTAVSK